MKSNSSQKNQQEIPQAYISDLKQWRNFMKGLKVHLQKEYEGDLIFGTSPKGNADFSFISLTTNALKEQKLKFVLI